MDELALTSWKNHDFTNKGSYLKIQPSWDLFSKQNIFMTTRDKKYSKLGLCRGRLGLSFPDKILVNTC